MILAETTTVLEMLKVADRLLDRKLDKNEELDEGDRLFLAMLKKKLDRLLNK